MRWLRVPHAGAAALALLGASALVFPFAPAAQAAEASSFDFTPESFTKTADEIGPNSSSVPWSIDFNSEYLEGIRGTSEYVEFPEPTFLPKSLGAPQSLISPNSLGKSGKTSRSASVEETTFVFIDTPDTKQRFNDSEWILIRTEGIGDSEKDVPLTSSSGKDVSTQYGDFDLSIAPQGESLRITASGPWDPTSNYSIQYSTELVESVKADTLYSNWVSLEGASFTLRSDVSFTSTTESPEPEPSPEPTTKPSEQPTPEPSDQPSPSDKPVPEASAKPSLSTPDNPGSDTRPTPNTPGTPTDPRGREGSQASRNQNGSSLARGASGDEQANGESLLATLASISRKQAESLTDLPHITTADAATMDEGSSRLGNVAKKVIPLPVGASINSPVVGEPTYLRAAQPRKIQDTLSTGLDYTDALAWIIACISVGTCLVIRRHIVRW